jgi:hypothetical protein
MGKDSGIQMYLQFEDYPRISLSSAQMTQFANLIQDGRKALDALKTGH